MPQTITAVSDSPLGKKSPYINQYAPELLFPIPRLGKRDEIGVPTNLPFYGFDTWNAYEVSWLNPKGKPVVAMVQFDISCTSTNIIESKSFKLYLNSFNNTVFESMDSVHSTLERDIQQALDGEAVIKLFELKQLDDLGISSFSGHCLDTQDISCECYTVNPAFLKADVTEQVSESLYSDLLKSNCLVTGQPDWGSVFIQYTGSKINHEGLLRYIVSFRDHNEFHEQCVERIFMDIMRHCHPESLTVEARYTRRGGLDINPIRSTEHIKPASNKRMARQ